jgi:hypothetical protein
MDAPDTRYARSGDLSIAYQAFGKGSVDIMHVSNWVKDLVTGAGSISRTEVPGR